MSLAPASMGPDPLGDEDGSRRALLKVLELLEPAASADSAKALSAALFELLPRLLDIRSMVIFHDIVAGSRPTAAFSFNTVERSAQVWQEMFEINPIQRFVQGRAKAAVITLSQVRTEQLRASPFYRRYMQVDGFDKQAVIPIRQQGRVRSAISIRRDSRQQAFGPQELALIRQLSPFLSSCFNRIWLQEQTDSLVQTLHARTSSIGLTGLFDVQGAPIAAAPRFWAGLDDWSETPAVEHTLPPEIQAAIDDLAQGWAAWRFGDDQAPYINVRPRAAGAPGAARVTLLRPLPDAPPIIEVALEADGAGPRPPERAANAALLKLTLHEREVAGLVMQGMTNAQIAAALGKAEGTVKIQLHGVYRKLNVASRSNLILMLR